VERLDAPAFAAREAAAKAVREYDRAAFPILRELIKDGLSAEQVERIKKIMAEGTAPQLAGGEVLRRIRAVAVLEEAATPDARKLLDELSHGAAEDWLTTEAEAAARRLQTRAR
jgi:hypothetical protein